jgi:hypothetical protein
VKIERLIDGRGRDRRESRNCDTPGSDGTKEKREFI